MKNLNYFLFFLLFWSNACWADLDVRDGDLFFQTSLSAQSLPIQLATHSPYSHVGIFFLKDGQPMIFEASRKVQWTSLSTWIARGKKSEFVQMRLKNKELKEEEIERLKKAAEKFEGKPYDPYFEWSDDRIYCSELVWKIYKDALGLELGRLQKLKDFDLTSSIVKKKLKERYGRKVPLEAHVLSPQAVQESSQLYQVLIR